MKIFEYFLFLIVVFGTFGSHLSYGDAAAAINHANMTQSSNDKDETLLTPSPVVRPPTSEVQDKPMLMTTSSILFKEVTISRHDAYDKDVDVINSTRPIWQGDTLPQYDHVTDNNDNTLESYEVPIPESLQERLTYFIGDNSAEFKQFPVNPTTMVVDKSPCNCKRGLCACCTGFLMSYLNSKACMNLKYLPEDFAFEAKMMFNNFEVYKTKISGRNPPPICINPRRLPFLDVCAKFHDIYFIGRNIHVCLEIDASFEGYELFNRGFDCMRLGAQGVQVVKPEEGTGLTVNKPVSSGTDADIDAGDDDLEDYDDIVGR